MLNDLTQFLLDAFEWVCNLFISLLIELLNLIILTVAGFFSTIIEFFPDAESIFPTVPDTLLDVSGVVNWFIPVSSIAECTGIVVVSLTAYFGLRPLLKFFQLT